MEKPVKLLFSHLFYHLGDLISRTTMRWGKGYGYPVYNRLMLLSSDLDTENKLWKNVKPKKKKRSKKK